MARRRRRRTLKPRVPSRVKRRKKQRTKAGGHQHPELIGLGLVALGVFLGSVVWAGWNGGYVGRWVGDDLDALIGNAALGLPAALAIVGALMVARSDLVDVRPFRTGLYVLACGLMITLGKDEGGYVGTVLGGALALAIGTTGVAITGVLTLLVGGLLVTGASETMSGNWLTTSTGGATGLGAGEGTGAAPSITCRRGSGRRRRSGRGPGSRGT